MGAARRAGLGLCVLCLARLAAGQYADMADTNYYDQYELYTGACRQVASACWRLAAA